MTEFNKEKYIESDGSICPYCLGNNIDVDCIDDNGTRVWRTCVCLDCEKEWNEIYKLVDVEEIKKINRVRFPDSP